MTDSIDIGVAVRQGVYWREDAQAYLSDFDYHEWLRKNYIRIIKGSYKASVLKARKDFDCLVCPLKIRAKEHYYSIVYGNGLGSLKFPDRVHMHCLEKYWEREGAK